MAEFTYNPIQVVQPNQAAILNDSIRCNKGYVLHRNESGLITLRGIVNNQCGCFARYQVTANGNISVPEGETVGPISVSIAINGEPLNTSRAIATPAAVDDYFNVTSTAIIDVARGCCAQVSLENVSDGNIPINVQNLNVTVTRIA
jgi:hypothetical protein